MLAISDIRLDKWHDVGRRQFAVFIGNPQLYDRLSLEPFFADEPGNIHTPLFFHYMLEQQNDLVQPFYCSHGMLFKHHRIMSRFLERIILLGLPFALNFIVESTPSKNKQNKPEQNCQGADVADLRKRPYLHCAPPLF